MSKRIPSEVLLKVPNEIILKEFLIE